MISYCFGVHFFPLQVLHLPVDVSYDIFKPLRFGKLNISSGISRSVVLKQLEDLWCRAIEECLDIPRKDFKVCW